MSAFVITSENLHTVCRDTIVMGRKIERNYIALVAYYGLTSASDSKTLTETARAIVLAAYPDTDPSRFVGADKGHDQRWKDARTVRVGLVRHIEKDETDKAATDWIRLVRQATENAANKGGFNSDVILAAVHAALTGGESEAA